MSQAEIAGARVSSSGELPRKGLLFPDCELISSSEDRIRLSDYRGHSSLVLILSDHGSETANLLTDVARFYDQFKHEEAEIIVIAPSAQRECARLKQRLGLPFPVLSDLDGRVHTEAGASNEEGHAAAALYITDRFGEIFAAYRARDGHSLPRPGEILKWLEFIKSQCPECEPTEWPA